MYKENVSCDSTTNADGALHATVSGGVAPYTYRWEYDPNDRNMGSAQAETLTDTDHDIINLKQGYYRLTVTDANLCTKVVKNNWYADNNMHVLGGWERYWWRNPKMLWRSRWEVGFKFLSR